MTKEHTQVFIRKNYDGAVVVQQHETELPTFEARVALAFMQKWALVAAEPDGEDTAGRTKLRRLTADEVAQFSCDAAQKAMDQFRARGWIKDIPTAQECIDRFKGDAKGNDDIPSQIVS